MNGKPTQNFELLLETENVSELRQIIEAALADQAHENEEWEAYYAEKRRECFLTEGEADKIANEILSLREEIARRKKIAADRIHRLEVEERRLFWFWKPALEGFTFAHRGKYKSVITDSAELGHRTQSAKIEVEDEAITLAWAVLNAKQCVKYTPSLIKKEIDAYVERSGELPPGCDRLSAYEKFSIKGVER